MEECLKEAERIILQSGQSVDFFIELSNFLACDHRFCFEEKESRCKYLNRLDEYWIRAKGLSLDERIEQIIQIKSHF